MVNPVRILHVVTYMGRGGLETMLMNYYRSIDRNKIQFDFLTHREERWDYDDEIEELGGRIYRISPLNPISPAYKNELKTFFRQHPEYRIVHVHQDCLSSVVLKAAKECGIPVRIAHSHSSSQDKNLKYPIKLWFKQFIPRYATHLIACSEAAGKWMFRTDRFTVLSNAVDAKKYSCNKKIRENMRNVFGITNELVVGHVGRFSPVKNHVFLIDILQELRNQGCNAKLLLVGAGKTEEQIRQKVVETGLDHAVIFAGLRSDVADCMQAMDVFVMPSLYEGLPVTMIEAQSSGLPCLISDKVPIECKKTDLVRQISLAQDASVWAKAVIEAAKTERRNTYQEIADSGFDIEENARWLQNFYLNLI